MLSRSFMALAPARPPFSVFYKSMAATLATTPAPQRMSVASALWRRTSPQYGIKFSAPRLAAAKQLYRQEGRRLVMATKPAARPAARRRRGAPAKAKPQRTAKAAPAAVKRTGKKVSKRRSKRASRKVASRKALRTRANAPTSPFVEFTNKVLKAAKLKPTVTNRGRVSRMWIMTEQQRAMSMSQRVAMAVRLLSKGRKPQRKLCTKLKRKTAKKSPKRAKTAPKKGRKTAKKTKASKKHKATAKTKKAAPRKQRLTPKRQAAARRRAASAAKAAALKASARKASARKASARKASANAKSSKAAVRRTKAKPGRKAISASAKGRVQHRRRENPYIEFYRRLRMTGLLPNGRKVVGSRQIKELWARTHTLPTIDARVAQATKLLEKQTGKSATQEVAATTPAAPAPVAAASIKVPENYYENPFGATYATLLPTLQDFPSSTRMAHVAKAWTNTEQTAGKRSAKERIAAVAKELNKQRAGGHAN